MRLIVLVTHPPPEGRLHHVIVVDELHLTWALTAYLRYYHRWRMHQSLEIDSPEGRETHSVAPMARPPAAGCLADTLTRRQSSGRGSRARSCATHGHRQSSPVPRPSGRSTLTSYSTLNRFFNAPHDVDCVAGGVGQAAGSAPIRSLHGLRSGVQGDASDTE